MVWCHFETPGYRNTVPNGIMNFPRASRTKRLGPKRLGAKTSRGQNGLVPKRRVRVITGSEVITGSDLIFH